MLLHTKTVLLTGHSIVPRVIQCKIEAVVFSREVIKLLLLIKSYLGFYSKMVLYETMVLYQMKNRNEIYI